MITTIKMKYKVAVVQVIFCLMLKNFIMKKKKKIKNLILAILEAVYNSINNKYFPNRLNKKV